MDCFIKEAESYIAEVTYTNFNDILQYIKNKNDAYVQNGLALDCLFQVLGGISKVKTEVPLYKLIASYAAKYRSSTWLAKKPTWVAAVNKIFKAAKIRGDIEVEHVLEDIINLPPDNICLLEGKTEISTTIGKDDERTLDQRLSDILSGKEDKVKKTTKKATAATEQAVGPLPARKRAAKPKVVDDIMDDIKITTNKKQRTKQEEVPDVYDKLEEIVNGDNDEQDLPVVPAKKVASKKSSANVSQLSNKSRMNSSLIHASMREVDDIDDNDDMVNF